MAKDSPRTTAGELQKIVKSQGQKTLKNLSNSTHMLFGRVSRKNLLAPAKKKTPAYSVIRHDWNFKWDWLLWSDETKKMKTKKYFLAAKTQDGFGEDRDKKYPTCTMKYTSVFLMLWAYISAGGPGHLV